MQEMVAEIQDVSIGKKAKKVVRRLVKPHKTREWVVQDETEVIE